MDRRRPCLILVAALALVGGCSGGSGSVENTAPTVQVLFPPPGSEIESAQVTVQGHAADESGVAAVLVNGVPATSSDGFATWQATVPIVLGLNTLTVTIQ